MTQLATVVTAEILERTLGGLVVGLATPVAGVRSTSSGCQKIHFPVKLGAATGNNMALQLFRTEGCRFHTFRYLNGSRKSELRFH